MTDIICPFLLIYVLSFSTSSSQADYFTCIGTIVYMRKENCLYQACPSKDCNKKVVDQQNGMFRCEKCDKEFPDFKYRLMLSVSPPFSPWPFLKHVFNSPLSLLLLELPKHGVMLCCVLSSLHSFSFFFSSAPSPSPLLTTRSFCSGILVLLQLSQFPPKIVICGID